MNSKAPVTVVPKEWYESKAVWINALTILGVVLVFVMQQVDAGTLPFALDAKWVVFLQAAINLVLRFVTSAPIGNRVNWNS